MGVLTDLANGWTTSSTVAISGTSVAAITANGTDWTDSSAYGDTAPVVTHRLTDWGPPAQREKTNLEWLDERVNEMRVKL